MYCAQYDISHHIPLQQRKIAVYIGGNINGLYHYLEMIVSPTTLKTLGQRYHYFGP